MKKIPVLLLALTVAAAASSCRKADSERPWGTARIYMPQANYHPYAVPNGGSAAQTNRNFRFDDAADRVKVFLGVYRSGLEELLDYSVRISSGTAALEGAEELPATAYHLPEQVSCPAGKRDATFYLSVDMRFLREHPDGVYALRVTISDPTRYTLNEELASTDIRIDAAALIAAKYAEEGDNPEGA